MTKKEKTQIVNYDAKQCSVCGIYVDINLKHCFNCGAELDQKIRNKQV